MKPPHILFLMSDEHRPDVTGYEGNAVVRTPTLDWLAETGTVFRNAYTPSPVCIPARQSMMAGQLPRTCGAEKFGDDLPPFSMTFAKRFAQHAYSTTCVGKLHHTGPDPMQGWTARPGGDVRVGASAIEGRIEEAFARYAPEPGTGKWSNQKEVEQAGVWGTPERPQESGLRDAACGSIRNYFCNARYDRPGHHQPLLLKLSLSQPHYPFFTDIDRFEYYLNRVPIYHGVPRFDHPVLRRSQNMDKVEASPRDVRRATAAYYGMVETIDSHYRAVLDTLEHVGENLDDWIIVYTSDHGEMLGEHGIWEKCKFFEASARVPLVIRYPRRFEPRVVHENVNLCDLFATLLEMAGLDLPDPQQTVGGAGLDSRSLVPLMEGRTEAWHTRHGNETVSEFGGAHLMIKRDALKYQYYGEQAPEVLFDLDADPGESSNLIDQPPYAGALEGFRRRRGELGFGPGADPDYRNAGYV